MADIKDTISKSPSPRKNTFSLPRLNAAGFKKAGERLGVSLIKHRDLWLLGIVLCLFAAALFIFWTYAWRINQTTPVPNAANQTKIDTALYQKIINRAAQKEKQFQDGLNMEYPDIFK